MNQNNINRVQTVLELSVLVFYRKLTGRFYRSLLYWYITDQEG